jgi:acetyl esterase/lipase
MRFLSSSLLIINLVLFPGSISYAKNFFKANPKLVETLNLSYGENSNQVLDIVNSEKCVDSPVILFVHGGSWRWGTKNYHRIKGKQFAKNGITFATMNYRLYPEVQFPSFPEDVALSIKWLRQNIAKYGGDPDKIFLMGHSAGAHSISLVGLNPKYLKKCGGNLTWIKGVIPMSCPYELDPSKEFLYEDLFPSGFDPEAFMPMAQDVRSDCPPFFIMHGLLDPIVRKEQAKRFVKKLKDSGGDAKAKVYASHGHFSLVRRTTSWHVWPKPLLSDIISFIESKI